MLSNATNSLLINVRPGVVYLNGESVPTDAGIYDIDGLDWFTKVYESIYPTDPSRFIVPVGNHSRLFDLCVSPPQRAAVP